MNEEKNNQVTLASYEDTVETASVHEYLDALGEQIENPHARQAIRREIGDHIAEQTEDYLREGMTPQAAAAEAVRQMGDPVQTGMELNRIHRPQFPTVLFGITVVLTLLGMVMQSILIPEVMGEGAPLYLRRAILCDVIGIGIILLLLYGNYMKLVKWVYVLYGGLAAVGLFIAVWQGSAETLLQWLSVMHSAGYTLAYEMIYYLWVLYPLLYVCILYRLRAYGAKTVWLLHGITLFTIFLLSQYVPCTVGVLEGIVITIGILCLAIARGILQGRKKSLYLSAFLPVAAGAIYLGSNLLSGIPPYQIMRVQSFLAMLCGKTVNGETDYYRNVVISDVQRFSLFGGQRQLPEVLQRNSFSSYMIHSIFLYLGIVVGSIVLLLMFGFACYALYISLRQSNRAALLLGSVCSVSILLRIVNAVLVNFGVGIYYTISIPFLSCGFGSCVVNALMVGVILCVFRNSNVMMEESPDKNVKKLIERV